MAPRVQEAAFHLLPYPDFSSAPSPSTANLVLLQPIETIESGEETPSPTKLCINKQGGLRSRGSVWARRKSLEFEPAGRVMMIPREPIPRWENNLQSVAAEADWQARMDQTPVRPPCPRRLQSLPLWDPTSEPLPPRPSLASAPSSAPSSARSTVYDFFLPPNASDPPQQTFNFDGISQTHPDSVNQTVWDEFLTRSQVAFVEEGGLNFRGRRRASTYVPPVHRPNHPPTLLRNQSSEESEITPPTFLVIPPSEGTISSSSSASLSIFPSPPLPDGNDKDVFEAGISPPLDDLFTPIPFLPLRTGPSLALRRDRSVPKLVLSPILSSRYATSDLSTSHGSSPSHSFIIQDIEETLASYFSPVTPLNTDLPFGFPSPAPSTSSPFSLAEGEMAQAQEIYITSAPDPPVLYGLALGSDVALRGMMSESLSVRSSTSGYGNELPSAFSAYSSPVSSRDRSGSIVINEGDSLSSSSSSHSSFASPNLFSPASFATSPSSAGMPDEEVGESKEAWDEWDALQRTNQDSGMWNWVNRESVDVESRGWADNIATNGGEEIIQFGLAF